MYIDGVIVYSLIGIAITCAIMAYIGRYAYRHIKADTEKAQQKMASETKAVNPSLQH